MSNMSFKSIEVDQFCQFRNEVAVQDLDPGLNVIAGNNEAGKSTLLQAIRAALFDRYTSNVGESFRPYGAEVSPKVHLVFEVAGVEYQLTKAFSRRRNGEATLEAADGRRWEGAATEEYLAELLGFSYAAKGGSRTVLQGLAGLLWVEQSKAYESVMLTDQSRRQVHAVFENEMRELLGGDHGEVFHRRITALRADYFDSRGKARGDYRRLQEQESELQHKLHDMRGELEEYEDKVDRLEQQQAELIAYQEDRALEKAEERASLAKEAAARVADLQDQVKAGTELLGRVNAERDAARRAWDGRVILIDELKEAQEAESAAAQAVSEKEAVLAPLTDRLSVLQNEIAELKSRKQDIDAELRLAHDVETFRNLSDEHGRLDSTLKDARLADAERRRCVSERDAILVTEETVSRLKKIERARDLAEERLRAAATRVEHWLEPGAVVHLGEESLANEGSVLLTQRTELQVKGVGQFAIIPGGEDLNALRRKVGEEGDLLAQGLAEMGADSVVSAEEFLRHREALDGQAAQHAATLRGLAPEGLQVLEDQLSSIAAQRDSLLLKVGENAGREFSTDDLEQEVQALRDQIIALEGDISAEESVVQKLREALAGARAETTSAERLAKNRASALERGRLEVADEKLANGLTEAEQVVDTSSRNLDAAKQGLDAENPSAVEIDVEPHWMPSKRRSRDLIVIFVISKWSSVPSGREDWLKRWRQLRRNTLLPHCSLNTPNGALEHWICCNALWMVLSNMPRKLLHNRLRPNSCLICAS